MLRVETEESYTSYLLQSEAMERMYQSDRRLTTELVLGVLRWRRRLDWIIENYAGRKIEEIDMEAQILLRMAFYQLKFLTKIPPRALVHEAVEQTKVENLHNLTGFVNAVLRRGLRDPGGDDRIGLIRDPVRRLSVIGSHPEWLVARWIERFGEERTRQITLANNATPITTVHVNTRKTTVEAVQARLKAAKVEAKPSDYFPDALRVSGVATVVNELVAEGLAHLQDEASRMVPELLGDCEGMTLLDLCAAPGGKSIILSRGVGAQGRMVAMDRYETRLQVLRSRVAALGIANVLALVGDATRPLPFQHPVDAILVDAPCSGLGTILRNPEIKWRFDAHDLTRMAERQSALLEQTAPLVKENGRLLYSTCSTEPEENETVVKTFLANHPEFALATPASAAEKFYDPKTGYFRTFPIDLSLDGFFAATLIKRQ